MPDDSTAPGTAGELGGGSESGRRFDFPESPLVAPATETERWLFGLTRFGMKPGLDTIRALAAAFGDPQRGLRFIHVAGTNGKGSVCHLLERQLRAAGYSTGLFTSPHLLHVGERLRVDGVPLDDAGVGALAERVRSAVVEREATFFETMTLMGLLHFAAAGVDWVLWETGLGGRLDSTRVAEAEAALVTSISLDHSRYLGSDLAGIAREKLAIGLPGRPLYSAITAPRCGAGLAARWGGAGGRGRGGASLGGLEKRGDPGRRGARRALSAAGAARGAGGERGLGAAGLGGSGCAARRAAAA
jgi:hypothetical protein